MAFGSMGDGDDDAPMADINVTPLVDVMLVLLIVFMITMPVLTHSLEIKLPVASNQPAEQQEKPKKSDIVTIAVNAQGQYALGAESDKTVDLEALKVKFAEVAKNPNQIVAISADKQTPHEYVVKVLEAARQAKIEKIAFNTEVQK